MLKITFDRGIEERDVTFVVIVCNYKGRWLFCKHRDRDTFESPGGKREEGETIWQTAHRELFEETGVTNYDLSLVSPYRMELPNYTAKPNLKYGMLFYANIEKLSNLPKYEMEAVYLFDTMPKKLTYADIQYELMKKVVEDLNLTYKIT